MNAKLYWKCIACKINTCGGRVHIENDKVIKCFSHNHVPECQM